MPSAGRLFSVPLRMFWIGCFFIESIRFSEEEAGIDYKALGTDPRSQRTRLREHQWSSEEDFP